jgi:hypothetical protein
MKDRKNVAAQMGDELMDERTNARMESRFIGQDSMHNSWQRYSPSGPWWVIDASLFPALAHIMLGVHSLVQ